MSVGQVKKRGEIAPEYKWRLELIYDNEDRWEEDYRATRAEGEKLVALEGKLAESAQGLYEALQLSEQVGRRMEKLYIYARMRRDEDNGVSHYQALCDRAETLSIELSGKTAWMTPELLAVGAERVWEMMREYPELKLYEYFFTDLFRRQEHVLTPAEERLLAMSADLSLAPGHIFSMLNNADIRFPHITDEAGQSVELSKGRYGSFMESSDRRVRKEAFTALYGSYRDLINTIGAALIASVKKDVFYARVRKYPSALAAALDGDNVGPEVYERLIEAVHNRLEPMYRYLRLRKRLLNLDELHMYDIYAPLVDEYRRQVPWEEGKKLVREALEPLGAEYLRDMEQAFSDGWIDVFENQGKTSGAYSWGCYDTQPYVLLNYDERLDDAFTLAHELGHSMHSYYSHRTQPYVYSQYTIFVAEVASTVNESLLIDHLLKQSGDARERAYLLNHYLEQFRTTVYRQTMFAEFEKIIHEKVEAGEALTPEALREIYVGLNRLYYGPEVVCDEEIADEWARIPHFYNAFYVYKYATGFASATAIKQRISAGEPGAVEDYLKFLSAGGSADPIDILKIAGVDLSRPEPVEKALACFAELVDQLEQLLG
ncbi:MAG: oligoendopeptidase F [Syntrophomonadaceae bacterium]|nr:oligoendopeptidase F [Syntrophomonadaceae bacterium]